MAYRSSGLDFSDGKLTGPTATLAAHPDLANNKSLTSQLQCRTRRLWGKHSCRTCVLERTGTSPEIEKKKERGATSTGNVPQHGHQAIPEPKLLPLSAEFPEPEKPKPKMETQITHLSPYPKRNHA
ncbi:hypothetical protein NMY22_g13462 [Coprinellus aureogranulatus]|nr:hypothetical protein NMY22_g13462 [Coprinellus aureogranulatus]